MAGADMTPDLTPDQLRAALAASQQQVADMAAAQEEFLRAVSHDLRAPLRHVTSYGTLVREVLGDLPPEVAQGPEVQEALDEGVQVKWLSTIAQAVGDTLTLEKMALDADGRPQPTGEYETLAADSLVLARDRFAKQWDKQVTTAIEVTAAQPVQQAGLQAVDYMLWALQRHYARQESRFLEMVWDKVSLIHAVDETDKAPYGVYYSKTKPLVGAALKNKVGI